MKNLVQLRIQESIDTKQSIINNNELLDKIEKLAIKISNTISNGGKIIMCGNGGSASDALHFAGEIVGRFQKERRAWPAIVINADVATMTAIANDYGYDEIFARQVEGQMSSKDMLVGFSTSGNSENIYRAFKKAKDIGGYTVGMLGRDGGKILDISDISLVIPCCVTARIQESHITLVHIICELVENILTES